MKRLALVLLVTTLLLVGGPAFAEMCTIDAVPAATLLVPYFEVDLNSADGTNTIFSINNASAAPALAHVTLWTDWSWPTIDFDIFLTGYDIQVVNLRDVFTSGNVPITADDQSDPIDSISPHGNDPAYLPWHPEWDGDFQDCGDFFPFYINPLIAGDNFERLVDGHTGQQVAPIGFGCVGADYGDNVARGYITVDSASRCSTEFANEPDYFGGLDPVANNNNQLWGEYFIIDPANDFAQGEPLVHIEAEDGFVGGANGYTFYSRYAAANADNREPLGSTFGARYLNNALFVGGTDFLVWRDSTSSEIAAGGYVCGGPDGNFGVGPSWFPMNETEIIAFDEFENATELCFTTTGGVISPPTPGADPPCFPLETQNISSTDLAFSGIGSPWGSGWMFLNLNLPPDAPIGDFDPVNGGSQSYVAVSHSANGRYSVGLQAVVLTSACSDSTLTLSDVCDPNYPGGPVEECDIN